MKRRDALAILAGAAVVWPHGLAAQQPDGMRRLGVLMNRSSSDPEGQANAAAFIQGLSTLRRNEGNNLQIDWRWAGSDPALFQRNAAELVALGPEVLVGQGSPSVEALRHQTSAIPIVFGLVIDPVGQGFVESLARPGGNITGFSIFDPPMAGKWAQMLTQINPPIAHVAVLFNPATARYSGLNPAQHRASGAIPRVGGAGRAG